MLPAYEVFALRYATSKRTRRDNFIVADLHDAPMPMDYFVWLVRGQGATWLVDTGFGEAAATARNRARLRDPIEALATFGVAPADLAGVILTHLHYDHAGNISRLPGARFHLQDREMAYATGRHMRYRLLRSVYDADDVVEVVRAVHAGRVEFHDGDRELAPGLQLIAAGGHTLGLQAVRVHTARGWIVLASDAAHYYDNVVLESPFPLVVNVADMLESHRRLLILCESPDHFIPGHDPLVLARFPRVGDPVNDVVALHHPNLQAR